MNTNFRIGLLTPFLDGDYYGRIFNELLNEANKHNSKIFTIQARVSVEKPVAFYYPVGTEVMDGWILMTNPKSALPLAPELLKIIESSGKPIVTIGYKEDTIRSHAVVIDNYQSTKNAILHLIREHGHRRIAFVGSYNEHIDIMERFEGYLEALSESGIPFDEELVFPASNALRQGGHHAAQAMLERGIDFTAIFASTDLNAMGVIERLKEAGYKVPKEIAVIGFDDLVSSATFAPPLTTIHQSFSGLARASFDIVYRIMSGETINSSVTKIQTEFITRASCGCTHIPIAEPTVDVHKQLKETNTNLEHMIKYYNEFVERWASATREVNFDFSNMFSGKSHWGCLAMWDRSTMDQKQLIVAQSYSKHGEAIPPKGLNIPLEQFPPIEWLPTMQENDFVRVQSVRNERGDWGFIAIVGPIDELVLISDADITQLSFTISASALERDELHEQIRSIAEQLEIVSRTTNDGIWDWDIVTNEIKWNDRSNDIFSIVGEELPSNLETLFNLVAPEDYHHVMRNFVMHLDEGTPLKMEFRIRGKKDDELWVYVTGDSIRNQDGKAIRLIGSIKNISEQKIAEKQIKHLAYHDVLTGLPNRRLARDRLKHYKEQANLHNFQLGVLLIDLDRFKIINDTLGHQAGDKLIQKVAQILEKTIRASHTVTHSSEENGIVARIGGDEFIVLLSHIYDLNDLYTVASRINQKISEPFHIDDHEIFTSASIGISVYPNDGEDFDELTRCADMAMYKAKENGKNQMEVYSPEINSIIMERFAVENQLRKALERDEFVLYYQPQLNLEQNWIVGVEALIRWNSPDRGLVSPLEFVPIAEETGLIIPIGRWVLKEACQQTKKWIDQGIPPITISVNISASQLQEKDFVSSVKEILEETKLPPSYLCLEITESTAIKNIGIGKKIIKELGNLGVNIAIDDFGTGYSSLAVLKQLPISNIKIDKSFIQDMEIDKDNAAIVRAIIAMAHSLDLSVTAEGVESEAQKNLLLMEKSNFAQGFLFARPLSAKACLHHMQELIRHSSSMFNKA